MGYLVSSRARTWAVLFEGGSHGTVFWHDPKHGTTQNVLGRVGTTRTQGTSTETGFTPGGEPPLVPVPHRE
jgi:hypothetical protein